MSEYHQTRKKERKKERKRRQDRRKSWSLGTMRGLLETERCGRWEARDSLFVALDSLFPAAETSRFGSDVLGSLSWSSLSSRSRGGGGGGGGGGELSRLLKGSDGGSGAVGGGVVVV